MTKREYTPRDPKVVSYTMSHIKSKETGIEKRLRSALHAEGFHYRKYSSSVYGHPDIVSMRLKIAIFCDSEFWHGYRFEENQAKIRSHRSYWIPKIERNIQRDKEVNEVLAKQGYTVLRFWGGEIEKDLPSVVRKCMDAYHEKERILSLSKSAAKTTLVYYEKDGCYLMLHRVKEKDDPNEGKWIGVGGHLEGKESILSCARREFREETGLTLTKLSYRGYIDFLNDACPAERMYLYKGLEAVGERKECDEGVLSYVKKEDIPSLNLWEGDKLFLPLLEGREEDGPFALALLYHGDALVKALGPFYPKSGPSKKKKAEKRRKKAKKA